MTEHMNEDVKRAIISRRSVRKFLPTEISKDIIKEIKSGNFREDLYHRLNVFNIKIEPLNKRIEDIPLLVEYFIENI